MVSRGRTAKAFAALIVVLAASEAVAEIRGPATLAMLDGSCDRLIIANKDVTKGCVGKLLNTTYPDGRSGFYFVTKSGDALTFSGQGQEVKPDPDTAIQPIDKVITTIAGQSHTYNAVGDCRFKNPTKGPAPVACAATTENGSYEAAFTSDGKPPTTTQLR